MNREDETKEYEVLVLNNNNKTKSKVRSLKDLNKLEKKKITEEWAISLLRLKKKTRVCTTLIVFIINLANLEIIINVWFEFKLDLLRR